VPLETFNYLDSLSPDNPGVSDPLVNGDDHIRGIKLALKRTFPNVRGEVTASHEDLSDLTGFVQGTKPLKLPNGAVDAPSLLWGDNASTGVYSPKTDEIGFTVAGNPTLVVNSQGGTFAGQVGAKSFSGGGIAPIGSILLWPSDVLPPAEEGIWAWCNGTAVSRADFAALFARIGTLYGAGNGTSTFGLPNFQEVSLVGKSGMGGASSPGRLASIDAKLRGILGAIFGSDTHKLSSDQMPSHYHSASIWDPGHNHVINPQMDLWTDENTNLQASGGGGFFMSRHQPSSNAAMTGVRLNSGNGMDTTNSSGGSVAHNNVQPSMAVNYIIRLA